MPPSYTTSSRSWKGPAISIRADSAAGEVFAVFPLNFVQTGGVNTWSYVLTVLDMLVVPVVDCPGVIVTMGGVSVELDSAPSAGDYIYMQAGSTTPIAFSRGPEYASSVLPASTTSHGSTLSDASTPSNSQSTFRWLLRIRDFECLVSGADAEDCKAAHIVPKNRLDVYREILEIPMLQTPPLYEVSNGLLLSRSLHHRYDRLQWSLYYQDGSYYVHFFTRSPHSIHHGKIITPDRFRVRLPDERPDPKLLAWHYAQCAKAHIRGFAVGMP